MSKISKIVTLVGVSIFLGIGVVACGGSSGGSSSSSIEGTLSADSSATSRELQAGEGGIAGVQVSALGGLAETDENGNFTIPVDGETFFGGDVLFVFSGQGIDTSVVLENVAGGPEITAFTDFVREGSGNISGESFDADGNLLGTTPGGRLNCSVVKTFSDGHLGALWKPHSERTGTVVVLMPPEYQSAEVAIYNSKGEVVSTPVLRNCCEHNGGREHVYFSSSAQSLLGASLPLTVRFEFADGFVDCRTVSNPVQRFD